MKKIFDALRRTLAAKRYSGQVGGCGAMAKGHRHAYQNTLLWTLVILLILSMLWSDLI
jgi:hypothetical protein